MLGPAQTDLSPSLARERVKLARRDITFDLFVPGGRVVLREPLPKSGKIPLRESSNRSGNISYGGHDASLLRSAGQRQLAAR